MVAKKRAYIFGFILLLLCSGVVFHKPLICLGFKKVIRKMPLFAKGKISYEQLGLTKEGLYLEGVVVEGFAHLQIEKVEALWKSTGFLRFECSYKVTQPTLILDVEKCKILTSRPLYDLFSSSFFSKKLTLEKGEVVFLGKEYQENLFFSCRVGGSRQHLGTMHCGFEKGVQQLRLDLYKNAQELVLDVEMQKAPLAPLLQLASDLNPKKSKWRMQEGCASGTFRLGITKEYKLHQLHTQLALEECKVESVASHGMLQLKAARFEAYLPQEKEDKIDLAATGVGEMFQTLVSKSSWEGGELIHIQPSTQKLWKLEGMKGTFFFEENRAPELVFEAILGEEGNKYPLSIQGQGLTMSENSWWMEFGCSLGVNLKQPMQISMYVALLESQEMCIKTSFQDLGGVELRMIQSWLQLFCPKLQEIDILGGKITTDITLHLFNNKLQSIALDKVHVQELTAKKIGTSWKIFCQGVQGRGKWFFPSMKYLKAPSWDISFQKLVFQHEDQPTWTISYEGYLASHDNQIDPSWIKASLPGIEAACFIRGPYPSIELSAEIAFAEEHIFSPFQQEVLQVASHIKPLNKIDLACKLVQGAEEMHLLGSTHLYYEGGTRDSVRFGSQMTKLLSPSTWKGWFQSEAVSENTYLGFLKYFRQKWYALGALHVTGEWDTGSLRFKLMSHEVTYDSEDIQIMMPRREEMHQGDFTFDRMHNQWHIFLPVKKACCQDKKVFLPFKDVDAEVTLEGLELKANILSATCENVAFAGRVEVAFSRPEWTVLKLYPETFHADSSDFMRFLGHLPEFKQIQLPWKGVIESVGYNEMKIGYNGERSEKETKLGIKIDGAEYSFNPFASLKELQCLLTWDSVQGFLEIKEVKGSLHLQREQEERTYRLNVQNLVSKNIFQKEWDFDVRIEAPTLDILRVVGTTAACERGWQLELKEDLTHFFGTKLALQGCKFTDGILEELKMASCITTKDLLNQLQFCALCGLPGMSLVSLQEMKNLKTEGELLLQLLYDKDGKKLEVDIESPALFLHPTKIENLAARLLIQQEAIELCYFKTSELSAEAYFTRKDEGGWDIPKACVQWKHSGVRLGEGHYKEALLTFDKMQVGLTLEELGGQEDKEEPLARKMMQGEVGVEGKLQIHLDKGWQALEAEAELMVRSSVVSDAQLVVQSEKPFRAIYSPQKGICFEEISLTCIQKEQSATRSLLEVGQLVIAPYDKRVQGKGCKLILSPEMFLCLAEKQMLSCISYEGGQLKWGETLWVWDNEIDTTFDIEYEHHAWHIQGLLKEGYYWIGDRSFYLQKFHYVLDDTQLSMIFGWDYEALALDVLAKVSLQEDLEAKILLKEGHVDKNDERRALEIVCRYGASEGLDIQSIEGELYGLDFAFRRNPRTYVPYVMILTGQMKVDTSGLASAFPQFFYEALKDLGMGSGYELSGDWVISKKALKDTYFKGYLKGRDFEFLGFYFKTLLSGVDIHSHSISIHDFSLSDVSGVVQIQEIAIEKSDEAKGWKVRIPEVVVQEFRPSFLKKSGTQVERIKPFVIKDLQFFNIEGVLGCKESFSGRGHLNFVNTFKKSPNLLDIPIEIIGRIGFDLGLFVPVVGKIELDMHEGKIFLKELKHAYSEGKRSKFYLSGYKDSYIGLDGNLFIDIKMKQYVLLKITQPFTLSIRGTLLKPQYSLR